MSAHIDDRKLFQAAVEEAVLDQVEVRHLATCEECMEMVRVFVRQNLSKAQERRDGLM